MQGWTIADWLGAYRQGRTPEELLPALLAALPVGDVAWITVTGPAHLQAQLVRLRARLHQLGGDIARLPLYGVPYAVKDNIDVAGLPTTAACPAFAYVPEHDATVIARLADAGAIVLGKTNLDQFATGLVGVRSPYGMPANTFDPDYVSGGSSAGSASLVARGIVPFALGTDTAGSGRVPAGLNNIVGLKPTRGAFSNTGVIPACRTLDCVSVFATTCEDAVAVYDAAAVFDPADGLSRRMPPHARSDALPAAPRFAIPAQPEFYGDALAQQAYTAAVQRLEAQGATCVPIDFSLFDAVTQLLYDGAWIAERYAAIRAFAAEHEADMHPVVRDIIFKARNFSAADAFEGIYRLADLKREADAVMAQFDALVVPTAPTHYRTADVLADPIRLNSRLGKYTNYVNLLDWSAFAVPANLRTDGLPFGITFIADAWRERALARYAASWHRATGLARGATGLPLPAEPDTAAEAPGMPAPGMIRIAVVGAHLRGMPLNHELTSRNARFVASTTTASTYRLFALADTTPPKPGLLCVEHDADGGAAIALELWDVPEAAFGTFVAGVPAPLGIGSVTLADGSTVKGFICEPAGLRDAQDITHFGGWRHYVASLTPASANA